MIEDERDQVRGRIYPAALICSVLANLKRDPDKRPEAWQPAEFMPGAKTAEDEMREFVEAIENGESFEVDPAEMEAFKRRLEGTFSNVV
jgi:hypothetical protein